MDAAHTTPGLQERRDVRVPCSTAKASERKRLWKKTAKGIAAHQRENADRRRRAAEFAARQSVCCMCRTPIPKPEKLNGSWTQRKCNRCKAQTKAARNARQKEKFRRRYRERKHLYEPARKAYRTVNKAKLATYNKDWWSRNREKFMNSESYAAQTMAGPALSARDIPPEVRRVKISLVKLKRELHKHHENNESDSGNAV